WQMNHIIPAIGTASTATAVTNVRQRVGRSGRLLPVARVWCRTAGRVHHSYKHHNSGYLNIKGYKEFENQIGRTAGTCGSHSCSRGGSRGRAPPPRRMITK